MQITSIAVIGAGPLGREIAYLAARAGYQTILEDVNPETIDRGLAAIRESLHAALDLKDDDRAEVLARISTSRSIEDAMRAAELVIDTTIDELETKLEVFTIFDKFARPGAILGCCTVSLSVADIATITFRAERCLGLRFAAILGLQLNQVQIVKSSQTDGNVADACAEVMRRLGLDAAVISESP
jgi:3-hydroxybutyryl-CoA dehydrogenase